MFVEWLQSQLLFVFVPDAVYYKINLTGMSAIIIKVSSWVWTSMVVKDKPDLR